MTENIIIALISSIVTLIGGYIATKQQRVKDSADIQAQIEVRLWSRVNDEIEKETAKRKELEKRVIQLEAMVEELESANEKKSVQIRAMRKEIARLEALVQEFRSVCSVLYGQLLDNGIKPAAEIPE